MQQKQKLAVYYIANYHMFVIISVILANITITLIYTNHTHFVLVAIYVHIQTQYIDTL